MAFVCVLNFCAFYVSEEIKIKHIDEESEDWRYKREIDILKSFLRFKISSDGKNFELNLKRNDLTIDVPVYTQSGDRIVKQMSKTGKVSISI